MSSAIGLYTAIVLYNTQESYIAPTIGYCYGTR